MSEEKKFFTKVRENGKDSIIISMGILGGHKIEFPLFLDEAKDFHSKIIARKNHILLKDKKSHLHGHDVTLEIEFCPKTDSLRIEIFYESLSPGMGFEEILPDKETEPLLRKLEECIKNIEAHSK